MASERSKFIKAFGPTTNTSVHHAPGSKKGRYNVQSLWVYEIVSFTFAALLFGVYLWLLTRYDERPVQEWDEIGALSRLFRTLPALISFLTTMMKGAILFPVASAIGQCKWNYFQRPRRLLDLEIIDSASRGYFGAIRLIFSRAAL